jgi:hypothetical protein
MLSSTVRVGSPQPLRPAGAPIHFNGGIVKLRLRIVGLVVLTLALFSSSAFAQGLTVGVKGGIGFSSLSAENDELDEFLDGTRTGGVIGGFVDVPVNDQFSVVIEGLYSQKAQAGP